MVRWPIHQYRVLKQVDLDITVDAEKLAMAARAVGENLHVLYERDPSPFWAPGSMPMRQVLLNAVWWTRLHPNDHDSFWPLDSVRRRHTTERLVCTTGR